MALGILLEKKLSGKPIQLYPVYSDSRIGAESGLGSGLSDRLQRVCDRRFKSEWNPDLFQL